MISSKNNMAACPGSPSSGAGTDSLRQERGRAGIFFERKGGRRTSGEAADRLHAAASPPRAPPPTHPTTTTHHRPLHTCAYLALMEAGWMRTFSPLRVMTLVRALRSLGGSGSRRLTWG